MRRLFVFVTLAAVALAMGMGGVSAQAQAANETVENATDPDEPTCLEPIDSETCITDWHYSGGTFTVEIDADSRTTITYAESGQMDEGTGQFATSTVSAPDGESTHTIDVRNPEGEAAVTFATQLSQREGAGAYISTGTEGEDPFRHFGGTSGLLSGVGMTTLLAGLGAWYVVRSEESGVIEA
ncbi:hypothetical protein [Natrialbaceae archaeon AArc-T1-2]|uniref:hypothetical protein n=1 Tax=Natrialbaceae archaeon AArc-T1-2 TaxID=3053904 RepID=UPI00255B2ACE|nr:hypothetical protein [Natrialbaceae archaeon AArc-T1-2]WIV67101.1 hypothetical protein QQ977_15670 [Natrialbaceae archaeon AArc-T1-2]